ncbi:ABC transporter permease [Paenibacillus popilliae]|uniref:ABC transporter permease n=1 Tax=Paenibacillus popilliae TaxID=78057 RepID=A0ABY3AV45_PAEPP|nr:FtsX-like permease family protein [Paenibacillus sp. SDF0028]TQR46687.1 ABC transporter permease [Paenibacillus sp. SDF0028]
MKIFLISIKNIFVTQWRTLILGSFIFFISFLMVFFQSFVSTMKANMEGHLINSLTGEIQFRSSQSEEGDMATTNKNWGEINYLDGDQVALLEKYLDSQTERLSYVKRVRENAMLTHDKWKVPAMIIGLDTTATNYQQSYKLIDGRYLAPNKTHEIMLTESQAEQFKVKVGDDISVLAQTKDGHPIKLDLKVVGVGSLELNSAVAQFDYAYVDLQSAQELMGLKAGEVTDFIIYTKDRTTIEQTLDAINSDLSTSGFPLDKIKISTWETMGGTILGGVDLYVMTFYSFLFILMLISCLLIINLVNMMSLERYQDIGTLRAIGFSRFRIIQIFMGEILIIVTCFALIGTIAGSALVLYFSKVGMNTGPVLGKLLGEHFFMKFEFSQIIPQFIIIFFFALISSLYPTYKAASLKPVETLKEI